MVILDGLYEEFSQWANLEAGLKQCLKGQRKYRREAIRWEASRLRNMVNLWREVKAGRWRPGDYTTFTVKEPKERRVDAPHLPDKIVQYAAHKVLARVYEPIFIKDSYACLEERGQHRAAARVQEQLRQCLKEHGEAWICKLDAKKFFYNIDRELLKKIIRKRIGDRRFLVILDSIIDSSPTGPRGLPLGNATSQDFAEIYLNEMDQAAKRFWAVKGWTRFRDDVVATLPSREEAKETRDKAVAFMRERLHLEPNAAKTKIFPAAQGVDAFGFHVYATHMLIRRRGVRQAKDDKKRLMKELAATRPERRGRAIKKGLQRINSRVGLFAHGNCRNLAHKIWGDLDFVVIEKPGRFFGRRPAKTGRRRA